MVEIFVPEGRLKIARRFNAGTSGEGDNRVPEGCLKFPNLHFVSRRTVRINSIMPAAIPRKSPTMLIHEV
jgi:hypothetical protein